MERNQAHFGQSRDCTLTSPPLNFTMKFTAACKQADAILEGHYLQPAEAALPRYGRATSTSSTSSTSIPASTHDSNQSETESGLADETDTRDPPCHQPLHLQRDTLPDLVSLLIDSFKYTTTPDVIPPEITEEEYKGKIKVWDERTLTSLTSNMHLGHLKAYWAEHTLPEGSNEAIEVETIRKRILAGHLTLLNYATQFGYSFDTWKCIVNTMLEKDNKDTSFEGNPPL